MLLTSVVSWPARSGPDCSECNAKRSTPFSVCRRESDEHAPERSGIAAERSSGRSIVNADTSQGVASGECERSGSQDAVAVTRRRSLLSTRGMHAGSACTVQHGCPALCTAYRCNSMLIFSSLLSELSPYRRSQNSNSLAVGGLLYQIVAISRLLCTASYRLKHAWIWVRTGSVAYLCICCYAAAREVSGWACWACAITRRSSSKALSRY